MQRKFEILFQACYISDVTREIYHKSGQDLLGRICDRHSSVISAIFVLVDTNIDVLSAVIIITFYCCWFTS